MTKSIDKKAKAETSKLITPSIIEKFVIRLPNGLRTQIKELSEHNCRSMNAEIIMVLEKHIQQSLMMDLSSFENDQLLSQTEEIEVDDQHFNKRLDSLPSSKKAALLALLG